MSSDAMPCGCLGHADNMELCQFPALQAERDLLRDQLAMIVGELAQVVGEIASLRDLVSYHVGEWEAQAELTRIEDERAEAAIEVAQRFAVALNEGEEWHDQADCPQDDTCDCTLPPLLRALVDPSKRK